MHSCGCTSVGDLLPLVSELSEDNLMVTTQLQSGCIGVTFFLWSVNLVGWLSPCTTSQDKLPNEGVHWTQATFGRCRSQCTSASMWQKTNCNQRDLLHLHLLDGLLHLHLSPQSVEVFWMHYTCNVMMMLEQVLECGKKLIAIRGLLHLHLLDGLQHCT